MNCSIIDINCLSFVKAKKENISVMLDIIRRCVLEINSVDYTQAQIQELLDGFTAAWLEDIINTRHYYEVWYDGIIVACGGVSRDYNQEKQSYFTAVFVNPDFCKKGIGRKLVEFLEKDEWCLDSNLIQIPSSKSSHEFYYKCGYSYRNYPPVFKDGTTIMYKQKQNYNKFYEVFSLWKYRKSKFPELMKQQDQGLFKNRGSDGFLTQKTTVLGQKGGAFDFSNKP